MHFANVLLAKSGIKIAKQIRSRRFLFLFGCHNECNNCTANEPTNSAELKERNRQTGYDMIWWELKAVLIVSDMMMRILGAFRISTGHLTRCFTYFFAADRRLSFSSLLASSIIISIKAYAHIYRIFAAKVWPSHALLSPANYTMHHTWVRTTRKMRNIHVHKIGATEFSL